CADHPRQRLLRTGHPLPNQLRHHRRKTRAGLRHPLLAGLKPFPISDCRIELSCGCRVEHWGYFDGVLDKCAIYFTLSSRSLCSPLGLMHKPNQKKKAPLFWRSLKEVVRIPINRASCCDSPIPPPTTSTFMTSRLFGIGKSHLPTPTQ